MTPENGGIVYSTGGPGKLHHDLDCSTRWVGWDFRNGQGPGRTQYRCRCDRHGVEWSGGLGECPMGPRGRKMTSIVVTLTFRETP